MRGVPSVATASDEIDMLQPRSLGQGRGGRTKPSPRKRTLQHPTGRTPPVDVCCRGRSPGSRVAAHIRLPEAIASVTRMNVGSPLTVAGAAPEFHVNAVHRLPS